MNPSGSHAPWVRSVHGQGFAAAAGPAAQLINSARDAIIGEVRGAEMQVEERQAKAAERQTQAEERQKQHATELTANLKQIEESLGAIANTGDGTYSELSQALCEVMGILQQQQLKGLELQASLDSLERKQRSNKENAPLQARPAQQGSSRNWRP